jgi:hypothetical protein
MTAGSGLCWRTQQVQLWLSEQGQAVMHGELRGQQEQQV